MAGQVKRGNTATVINTMVTAVGIMVGAIPLFHQVLATPAVPSSISGFLRLQTVLFIGVVAAGAHGVCWIGATKYFGLGLGDVSLPRVWGAVILSLTMTLPLTLTPPLYQLVAAALGAGITIIGPYHYFASSAVLVAAALGHLLLYGTKVLPFPGLRNVIAASSGSATLGRWLFMEAVYGIVHFTTIVFVYQECSHSLGWPPHFAVISATLYSALFWLVRISTYIFLMYPASLHEKVWIQLRASLSATLLMIALTGGILT
jgi:hypothetical protein